MQLKLHMQNHVFSTIVVLGTLMLFIPQGFVSAEYYECSVQARSNSDTACQAYSGRVHICQIYQGYDGTGVPDFCSDFCLARSEIPAQCAEVSVQISNNKEAHERFLAKVQSVIPIEVFSTILAGTTKWWRAEMMCEKKTEPRRMGEIAEVTGDGKAWINRGLDTYRAVRFAPLLAGDTVVVPEGMSVKVYFDSGDSIEVPENTKMYIGGLGIKGEQCLREYLKDTSMSMLGRAWNFANEYLQGEHFEILRPTVVFGVRG